MVSAISSPLLRPHNQLSIMHRSQAIAGALLYALALSSSAASLSFPRDCNPNGGSGHIAVTQPGFFKNSVARYIDKGTYLEQGQHVFGLTNSLKDAGTFAFPGLGCDVTTPFEMQSAVCLSLLNTVTVGFPFCVFRWAYQLSLAGSHSCFRRTAHVGCHGSRIGQPYERANVLSACAVQ